MTAEIAVLNKSAVALAADSAVTIGRGASAKIYNSVSKIFELHESAPVGIMIYGRLDFMGLPLETIIKEYRRQLSTDTFPKIVDYKDDFIKYLSGKVPVDKPDKDQIVLMITADIIEELTQKIDEKIYQEIDRQGKYLKSKNNIIAQGVIKEKTDELGVLKRLPYASKAYIGMIEADYGPSINRAVSLFFNRIVPSQKTREALHKLVVMALSCEHLSSYSSGVVIAGFGDDERCPSLERFEMEGIIGNNLKYVEGASVDVGRRGPHAEALGFAQSDMIDRFMHGIDPELYEFSQEIIKQSIEQISEELIAAFTGSTSTGTGLPAAVVSIIEKIKADQLKELEAYKQKEYTKPIFDMIRHMPKQELANMARALIELTSLKRKVSREQESVGGDVDVAVISKSEGFVWVKRKHYFPPELNSRFFARRYKQAEN
ncbi:MULTISPECIES: hypothetical protein [Methylobacteriaceae]|uniref:ATP-dependent protease HslVU (ClpYQ) peptidase subunit n=1 Tax=Methylorubrum thiocyanatum TaxID=47958 RepID=A0AA40S5N5_9HYPH|nr:hypothetical protein [Methylorubrum thiocyanatum]MBA8915068.1 ATP-dependent protease HslVU (ClpYQ) peptidase subunit [Methylorubrum thiocyanatum]